MIEYLGYKLDGSQLTPKNGDRWMQMVSLHQFAGNAFPQIPAEQWYYFYVMGVERGKKEAIAHYETKKRKKSVSGRGEE